MMQGGRTKARITVAVDPAVARELDAYARGLEITRSAAAEEAFVEFLRVRNEEQRETLDRLSGGSGVGADMVLEFLRYQFPNTSRELSAGELKRRAADARDRRWRS